MADLPVPEPPRVGVVVLAYGPEPLLADCLAAIRASTGVAVELVLVDNGCTRDDLAGLAAQAGARLLRPGTNTGFAGGCNLGAAALTAPYLALVNSDAVVEPDALAALVRGLQDPRVGVATGLVVLHDRPDTVNAAGNPVHWSLLSWAGGYGEPVDRHDVAGDVASASGALLAVRRADWVAAGGLSEVLFAYGEDAEYSLRQWAAGRRVVFRPGARARHAYEFARTPTKLYLLERNRWINLLTVYERRTLLALAPGLALLEAALAYAAMRGGWFDQKRAGWRWLVAHRADLRARRAVVQAGRTVDDSVLLGVLADRIEPGAATGLRVPPALNAILAAQGRLARRLIRPRAPVAPPHPVPPPHRRGWRPA